MESQLTDQQLSTLRTRLTQQLGERQDVVRRDLVKSNNEQYVDLVGETHDPGDESVASLLADLNLSFLDQHVGQIRSIEAAFARMDEGTYGICVECGVDIPYERLLIQPVALRCHDCQARDEVMRA